MRFRLTPLFFFLLVGTSPVLAAKIPNPLITDERVKQVAYDPNQVYEIVGTYGYQTSIEFASDENVKVVTLGDSIAWQTVPYQNRLFIKPVEPNAATNLTVITDQRTYYFKLNSGSAKNQSMTFLVRFIYPGARPTEYNPPKIQKNEGFNLANLNMDYSTSGDLSAIPLKKAFDDGEFTYFQFAPNGEIPTVYTVRPDGTEALVNTRREGLYLVVERTASAFTLRSGSSYLCIKNNSPVRTNIAQDAEKFVAPAPAPAPAPAAPAPAAPAPAPVAQVPAPAAAPMLGNVVTEPAQIFEKTQPQPFVQKDIQASTWKIAKGQKISTAMSTWVKQAGWQNLYWEASELESEVDVTFPPGTTFETAVTQTVEALSRHGINLGVMFYGGNKVVRVTEGK